MGKSQNYIIEFSNYLVLGFLRIENLYALFNKSRAYSKYVEIPHILQNYIEASGSDGGKNKLQESFTKLITINDTDMYSMVVKKMPNVNDTNGNNIDKLNDSIHKNYKIETEQFLSSVIHNKTICNNPIDQTLEKQIILFIDEYSKLNSRSKQLHIQAHIIRDIKMCIMISATEFTNAIHHIYIAYYMSTDIAQDKNIEKAIRHLQRAILDIKEALNLSDQQNITSKHVQERLNKIYNVGSK